MGIEKLDVGITKLSIKIAKDIYYKIELNIF